MKVSGQCQASAALPHVPHCIRGQVDHRAGLNAVKTKILSFFGQLGDIQLLKNI
jgi:hypothetical protein